MVRVRSNSRVQVRHLRTDAYSALKHKFYLISDRTEVVHLNQTVTGLGSRKVRLRLAILWSPLCALLHQTHPNQVDRCMIHRCVLQAGNTKANVYRQFVMIPSLRSHHTSNVSLHYLLDCQCFKSNNWKKKTTSISSHTRTVVRECFKGDEASQWKRPKFDPSPHQNPLTDLHKNWQS